MSNIVQMEINDILSISWAYILIRLTIPEQLEYSLQINKGEFSLSDQTSRVEVTTSLTVLPPSILRTVSKYTLGSPTPSKTR
jgi:hypothetical protein